MPLIEQKLDTGFAAYQRPEIERPPAPNNSSLQGLGALITGDLNEFNRITSESAKTIGAAFRMENDVLNMLDLAQRPQYKADPTFDVVAQLKADDLWENAAENFLGVNSREEYLAIKARMTQEEKDRQTLAAAGVGGFVAQMTAGLLSPTALLPFVGGLRGAKAVGAGIGMGFAGGALQEIPLQLAQETRSLNESVSSVAMSTVLGGVLGGAVAYFGRNLDEVGEELVRLENADMAVPRGGSTISNTSPASVGAASAEGPVPELLRMSPLPKFIDPLWDAYIMPVTSAVGNLTIPNSLNNVPGLRRVAGRSLGELTPDLIRRVFPVVYNLSVDAKTPRQLTARLSDSGLQVRGAPVGGTVENRIRTYDAPLAAARDQFKRVFARYTFGAEAGNKVGAPTLAPLLKRKEKLKFTDFRAEVGRAMRSGDQHEIPEVSEMAKYLRTEVYDPLFKAAKEQGLFKNVPDEVLGDSSYLNRVYDLDIVSARKPEFIEKLANHYNEKLTQEFREAAAKLQESSRRLEERAEDFGRSDDEITALRAEFEERLTALEEGRGEGLVDLEEQLADLRADARAAPRGSEERKALNEQIKSLESEGGEALVETRATRSEIKRRLKNLRQARAVLEKKQQAKIDKIERAEDLSFNTLTRLVKRGQKVLKELDNVSDAKLEAELSALKNQFAAAAAKYDRNEERIAGVFDDDFIDDVPTSPFVQAAKIESTTFDKMTDVAEAIEQLDVFDRNIARDAIQAGLDDAIMRAQSIVERRGVRNARLAEQAQGLDPAAAAARIDDLRVQAKAKSLEFSETWRTRGADDLDPVTGVADFRNHARNMAEATTDKILGINMRLPGFEMIMNPKDAELARVLDIDSNSLLSKEDGVSFLVDDAEELMSRYVRTLAPDIELHRAFGDFAPDLEMNVEFKRLNEEYLAILTRTQEQMRAGINPKTGKKVSTPYTQRQIDEASKRVTDEQKRVKDNLTALIERARYQRGLPKDPAALGHRAGRVARNLNVTRFMGGVVISSLPDIARPIMKYGLIRTASQGYIPFIKRMMSGKMLRDGMTNRHLRATGAGLDMAMQGRMQAVFGTEDYIRGGTKIEKGLEWTANRMGNIAAFAPWTDIGKQIAGSIANARLMDSLAVVAGGEKASARELKEAVDFLANGGVDDELARRMWTASQQEGGADLVDGQWWANTEMWDPEARRAYSAFMYRETANTIITPGIDMPLFMDSGPIARLLFQFKSFGMTSTTRALMAGLQQRDMAFYTGATISLALGALSYYTYANIVGGPILAEMQKNFAEGNWDKFADEAINRSGLLGIGAEVQSIGSAIPGVADKVTFSGKRSTRQGASNLFEAVAGPTFGDLANTTSQVITGAYSPTQGTLHQMRTLTPLQNHTLLRGIYDQIEDGIAAKLPENRR